MQALIIIAYGPKWYSFLKDMHEFKKIISVFITASALRLLQGTVPVLWCALWSSNPFRSNLVSLLLFTGAQS